MASDTVRTFAAHGEQAFVSLTTFRKSGEAVSTPVWVARESDDLLVVTPTESGKVKRLRNSGRVEIRPCSRTGAVAEGVVPVPGHAEIVADPAETERLIGVIRAKYGLEYRVVMFIERVVARRRKPRVVLRIRAAGTTETSTTVPWDAEAFWDDRYRSSERVWSGRPNAVLTREVSGLAPGTALDLGCAEGADAIWLAQNGWRVTAVDVSTTALERGAARAASAGVADQITWQKHDLARTFPAGSFDLVSAQFLHSPSAESPRDGILRSAAAAVAPGGLLLIVSHAAAPWGHRHDGHMSFATARETFEALELDPAAWETLLVGNSDRLATGPEGQEATLTDTIVKLRRRGAGARD